MDEFDHAFRASSVSHGQLHTDLGAAPDGRGELVLVSPDLADAAFAICDDLKYTGPDNCTPVAYEDGRAVIASAASNYQPLYYLTVSWIDAITSGTDTLLLMRGLTSLIFIALIALACWHGTGERENPWTVATLMLVATPTTLYSAAVVSANGIEIALGLLLWVLLLKCAKSDDPRAVSAGLIIGITITSCFFAWLRPFSPVWLFIVLVSWLVLVGLRWFWDLCRSKPWLMTGATLLIAISAAGSSLWMLTLTGGASTDPATPDSDGRASSLVKQPVLWVFQVISAVPYRNVSGPLIAYAAGLCALGFLLALGVKTSTRRARLGALLAVVAALAVSLAYSWVRYPYAGTVWQGRYIWCVLAGVLLLLAGSLQRSSLRSQLTLAVVGSISIVVMNVSVLLFVLDWERDGSPLAGTSAWMEPSTLMTLTLALVGSILIALAPWPVRSRDREPQPPAEDADAAI